jgi:hypothetical protein
MAEATRCSLISANTVRTPSPTSACAIALPMPLPAPVTRAASWVGSKAVSKMRMAANSSAALHPKETRREIFPAPRSASQEGT